MTQAESGLIRTNEESQADGVHAMRPSPAPVPLLGKFIYHFLPVRRETVLRNLRRAFPDSDDAEIRSLAQASYGHLALSIGEFARGSLLGERRSSVVRIEGREAVLRAAGAGKGMLVLTGHFGNWEVALPLAIEQFPHWRDRFHLVRKHLPGGLDAIVTRRFTKAGIKIIPSRGALDAVLDRLASGDAIIVVFDQHAGGHDGVIVDFMGHPASTFRSLALVALTTGAPVVPAACYREPDGAHVVRFEEALETIETGDAGEEIRLNTRMYNAALENLIYRHPEQWFWLHRRWKDAGGNVV